MRTPHLLVGACAAGDSESRYRRAALAVWDELIRALGEYPDMWRSLEEGAMVLAEEVDELWEEVRRNRIGCARAEAAQVGAMAVRFIADLYEPAGPARERCRAGVAEQQGVRAAVGPTGRAFSSSHEGFGFLKREYDALWSAVRFDEPARPVAARVAAIAVRFIAEVASAPVTVGGF
jgi:hypothetical protein